MGEQLSIAFLGAVFALAIREMAAWRQRKRKRKKLVQLAMPHLLKILEDLRDNPGTNLSEAQFTETNYWELIVGNWIYDQVIENLDAFPNLKKLEKTIDFFHHYKVNMATLRSRLASAKGKCAVLEIATYQKLVDRLHEAIDELERL